MIPINIMEDENLMEVLENILSGILNTSDLEDDSPTLTRLLNLTFSYIKLEEMEMEYYVLFSYLNEMNKIMRTELHIRPSLNEETLDRILTNDLPGLIRKPELRLKNWLKMEGLEYNLDVAVNAEDAMSKVYQRSMSLYKRCQEKQVKPEDVIAETMALSKAYVNNVSVSVVNHQVNILNGELRIGRKRFSGPEGWLEFTQLSSAEIQQRIKDASTNSTFIDSISDVKGIFRGSSASLTRLANLDVPIIDDMMLLNRHRLSTICALENVGKTKFMVNAAVKVLLEGHKVRIMYGESQESTLLADIMVAYIYHKHGLYVRPQDVINLNDDELDEEEWEVPENIGRIINKCMIEVVEKKQLALIPSYEYQNLYGQLKRDYETRPFDFLGIDHSCTLSGEGDMKENLDRMSYALRDFKRDYPVSVMILSQLSTAGKQDLSSSGIVVNSPTKGSATLSQETDVLLVLNDKGDLVSKGLLSCQVYKVRGAAKPDRLVMLKKDFSVSAFVYDPKLQILDDNSIGMGEALDKISTLYNDEPLTGTLTNNSGFFNEVLGLLGNDDYDEENEDDDYDEDDDDSELDLGAIYLGEDDYE